MLEEIIKRRRKGLSFRQIAKELNTTAGKVQYRWNKWIISQENAESEPLPFISARLLMEPVAEQKVFLHWTADDLPRKVVKHFYQCEFHELVQLIRIYDVTDLIFNGSNAHHYYEMAVPYSSEKWSVKNLPVNRNYLAELGVKMTDIDFFPILRSNTVLLGSNTKSEKQPPNTADLRSPLPGWREHVSTYSYYSASGDSPND